VLTRLEATDARPLKHAVDTNALKCMSTGARGKAYTSSWKSRQMDPKQFPRSFTPRTVFAEDAGAVSIQDAAVQETENVSDV